MQLNPKPEYTKEEPRLSIYNDKYTSVGQLNQWLDVVFKGQFTSIDLSHEYNLPAQHQGVILDRLTQHYQSKNDVNLLLSLDLSHNNLKGQVDKLIALLEVCQQLSELKLAHVKFKPGELTQLTKALVKHPQLKELALCVEPETSYKKSDQSLLELDIKQLAEFVSNSKTIKSLSLTQGQHDLESERMSAILAGLTKNKSLQQLIIELYSDGAEDHLIQLIQNTKLNQLTLKFVHCWHYRDAIKAALSSNQLTHLSIFDYPVGRFMGVDEAFNQKSDSKLTHLTLKSCDVNSPTLRSIKLLPLEHLDLSNNRLYADEEGDSLIKLIEAQAETLESLNLTGHQLNLTHSHPSDNKVASVFLGGFAEALAKCKKLKSLKFDSGEREFKVHAIASFIHSIKRHNPSLVIDSISLPHNSMNDKQHMFNETSKYLKFVLQDMQQQKNLKPGLSQHAWQEVNQRYEHEMARLLTDLIAVKKDKLNPPRFSFFGGYEQSGPLKWLAKHQTMLEALEKKDYSSFHIQWHKWEGEHSADETDINIGVYFGFFDECLLLYVRAIRQCQQKGYDWIEAYPNVPVLEHNYSDRLTELQLDEDEKSRAFYEQRKQERLEQDKKDKGERELSQKIKKGEITELSQLVKLSLESTQDQKVLTYK